jgi:nitrous oxidase accessory protein NosD
MRRSSSPIEIARILKLRVAVHYLYTYTMVCWASLLSYITVLITFLLLASLYHIMSFNHICQARSGIYLKGYLERIVGQASEGSSVGRVDKRGE